MARTKTRINLFSPVLAVSQAQVPGKPWWLLGAALVIGWIGVGVGMQLMEGWKLARQITAQKAALEQARQQQQLLDDQLRLLTSGLSSQVTIASAELVDVINRRVAWTELFQEVSVRVPDGVWLLRVDVEVMAQPKGKGRTRVADKKAVVLTGFARSHQSVGQLLSALERSAKFTSVSLKFADRRGERGGEQVNFEINGQLL
jgi:Tfp pilus assembly protein PilN